MLHRGRHHHHHQHGRPPHFVDISACRNPPPSALLAAGNELQLQQASDLEAGGGRAGTEGGGALVVAAKGAAAPPPAAAAAAAADFRKLLGTNMANVRTMLAYTRTALSLTGAALGMLKLGDPSRQASWALAALAFLGVFVAAHSLVVFETTRRDLSMSDRWPKQHARFLRSTWVAAFTCALVLFACTTIVYDHFADAD
tara:strand:- start:44 stop:640 length:597 start_codon:yes stop_codon:yes gene_type:complete